MRAAEQTFSITVCKFREGGTCFAIHSADVAAVVTTARGFTTDARAYAERTGIRLMDARALAAWDSQTGPPPWQL